jgi:hypothetical protein
MQPFAVAYEKPVGVVVKQVSLEFLVSPLHLPSGALIVCSLAHLLL